MQYLLHLGLTGLDQLISSAAQVSLTVRDEKIQKCGFLLRREKKKLKIDSKLERKDLRKKITLELQPFGKGWSSVKEKSI